MRDRVQVRLPGGLWLEGDCHRDVTLRTFTGRDEEAIGATADAPRAAQVSHLLARCVERLGDLSEITPDTTASLTVGDREALLLRLCALVLGSRLECLARCEECNEIVDLSLSVDDLLQPPYDDWLPEYETQCDLPSGPVRVKYRLPTGADQTAAASLAARDLTAAGSLVLQRCIVALDSLDGRSLRADQAEPLLADRLPALMAARDVQAESILDFSCPTCGTHGNVLFDAADHLFRELGIRQGELYGQVHRLALAYHWSEAEILDLSWTKRHRYLNLLADEGA
jgi:hypothetical protein